MDAISNYNAARALMQLIGDSPEARERLYRSLPANERHWLKQILGGWVRGALIMNRFTQPRGLWISAMARVIDERDRANERKAVPHVREDQAAE